MSTPNLLIFNYKQSAYESVLLGYFEEHVLQNNRGVWKKLILGWQEFIVGIKPCCVAN